MAHVTPILGLLHQIIIPVNEYAGQLPMLASLYFEDDQRATLLRHSVHLMQDSVAMSKVEVRALKKALVQPP